MPSTTVVSHAPSKNVLWSNSPDGVGSNAPVLANSPIQVVPIMLTSGVCWPAMAVAILSWAASNGNDVTVTLASGLSLVKSSASWVSFSPSAPMAHTVISPVALPAAISLPAGWPPEPESPSSRPQPVTPSVTASSSAVAYLQCFITPPSRGGRCRRGAPRRGECSADDDR